MDRTVEPEILDSLPSEDPAAVKSRKDLRLINWIMGNTRWLRDALQSRLHPDDIVVELGAGGGELGRALSWRGNYTALVFAPRPEEWPASFQWLRGDFFEIGLQPISAASVVTAGLVLHHFQDEDLRRLGSLISNARLLVICEPARRKLHIAQGFLLRVLGINWVTRHDLPVSVRAGFLGNELPVLLGLNSEKWSWNVRSTFFGSHRLVAEKR